MIQNAIVFQLLRLMKKYTLAGLLLLTGLATTAYWWLNREVTLVDLQKELLFAKTVADTARVIDRLEQYYLNMEVPDSIVQEVDSAVAAILEDTTKLKLEVNADGVGNESNVYKLEARLQELFEKAMIARAREEEQIFRSILVQAIMVAQIIDIGKGVNYWMPFIERANRFTKNEAFSWLKAKRAELSCRSYQDHLSKFEEAERHAALGLRYLQQASDERLRLDIMQRLQYILYFHRSIYELSQVLGQKLLPHAEEIKHYLRANGIIYHRAEALIRIGQNQAALPLYEKIIRDAQAFRDIRSMSFFSINGLLGEGKVFLELGDFDKAINACHTVEKYEMDSKAVIRLGLLKADIYRAMANYEQAQNVIKDGMAIAEVTKDTVNLLLCLNGFGLLFERLQEYDLALDYYKRAMSLFGDSEQNMSAHLSILNNIADVAIARQDFTLFDAISQKVKKLIVLAHMPWQKAELLRNIGNLYKKTTRYSEAIPYFQEAASIYNSNGFLRLDLGTRIDLSDCWIGLSKFDEARVLLEQVEVLAKEIKYDERVIDAVGRRAKIEYREGNATGAMAISRPLLNVITGQSTQIKRLDFLISYRQKLYDFLKDNVVYELALHGQDSAFVRLANAKAYALKNHLINLQFGDHSSAAPPLHFNLTSTRANLKEKALLIDYMVTDDTLYAFVLRPEGLKLFRKKIDIAVLRKTATVYSDSISKTVRVFKYYNALHVVRHYAGTIALSKKLYEDLLGWSELDSLLKQTKLLYVIPDEFLYEIPFSTLAAPNLSTQSFVANQSAVLTLPSTSFLHSSRISSERLDTDRVLISVDMSFPGAEKFVAKVKELFPLSEELSVKNRTFVQNEVLAKMQENYQIYIFVGHGAANAQYPDLGYIDLSVKIPNMPSSQITRLTVADLEKVNWLGAEMVILVGCETASGKLYRGTGISGLHQEFLVLGAQNVVGNLWQVNASHAITQMEEFLISWRTTANAAQALQACQAKAIQELQKNSYFQKPHPYFGGSYIISTVSAQQ